MSLEDYMRKSHLTLRQASVFLGCPVSFLREELRRQRISRSFHWFRLKFTLDDLIRYKREISSSVVWDKFASEGYRGLFMPNEERFS